MKREAAHFWCEVEVFSMTPASDKSVRSPWFTVWFSPRRTIERLVAVRPTYLVWLLTIFGTIASLYSQLSIIDGATSPLDWQLASALVLAGVLLGLVWLYLSGLTLSWIGSLLGGKASALHIRAAFAWSSLPIILGFIIILLIAVVNGRSAGPLITPDIVPLLVAAFSSWSLVLFLLMLGRVERFGFWRTTLTYALNLVLALGVTIFIRGFLYQPFHIPAASMRPALLVGDYIFVSKFAYGYSRFSLPYSRWLPSGRFFSTEPSRGDVVVFRVQSETEPAIDYVKRIVGLPGDRIQMKQGQLFINDMSVEREHLADADDVQDACGTGLEAKVTRWRETLPNGVSYETLHCVDNGASNNTDVYTVPPGHFFMLGDNRDNSTDSRVLSVVGYIPFENLIGRVSLIFFSREDGDGWPSRLRIIRIGQVVR
jgi:signal peptidase I